jgi:hypothetical protein
VRLNPADGARQGPQIATTVELAHLIKRPLSQPTSAEGFLFLVQVGAGSCALV